MQIEIDEIYPTKTNGFFWGTKKKTGMEGGNIKITLSSGICYSFSIQEFGFYVAHRAGGKGFAKNVKLYEEAN